MKELETINERYEKTNTQWHISPRYCEGETTVPVYTVLPNGLTFEAQFDLDDKNLTLYAFHFWSYHQHQERGVMECLKLLQKMKPKNWAENESAKIRAKMKDLTGK